MAQFKLILLDEQPTGEVGAEVLFSTDKLADIAKLRALLSSFRSGNVPPSARAGAKGRPVVVVGKAEDANTIFQPGDQWRSAYEASIAMGYGYNAIAQELKKAKLRGETSALIRGVEVQYLEDLSGRD